MGRSSGIDLSEIDSFLSAYYPCVSECTSRLLLFFAFSLSLFRCDPNRFASYCARVILISTGVARACVRSLLSFLLKGLSVRIILRLETYDSQWPLCCVFSLDIDHW